VFGAPRELVWREWTDPIAFADWFGGTETDIPLSTVAMDVREGGAWRATMYAGSRRHEIRWAGEYVEVVAPKLLVFTVTDRPQEDRYDLVIVVLTELGRDETEMLFRQRGHMTPEQYGRAEAGWAKFFDRIDERLAQT
jgi:uncharacterized protein YndB with AHSA1/START domain